MSSNPTSIEELDSTLHLVGCQSYSAGYNDAKADKPFDMDGVEQREATTLEEVSALLEAAEQRGWRKGYDEAIAPHRVINVTPEDIGGKK